jgi:hypothetical protein
VLRQVRAEPSAESLAASLRAWQDRHTARARAMLTAAGRLDEHLRFQP